MKATAKDRSSSKRPAKTVKAAPAKAKVKAKAKPAKAGKAKAKVEAKAPAKPEKVLSAAQSKALAAVDQLLVKPGASKAPGRAKMAVAEAESKGEPATRVGAAAAPAARAGAASGARAAATTNAALAQAPTRTTGASVAAPAASATEGRFERAVARAEKGEPGPIRLADLNLDDDAARIARESGRVDLYVRLLQTNPAAQPGRPLVNVVGTCDQDLQFHLLSLHELVLAARELGRDTLQVSLVRLPAAEAADLLARPVALSQPQESEKHPLSAKAIAEMNGFLELRITDIDRSENLRQEIDTSSHEFHNLVESIRTIGLQNPPVVEVREVAGGEPRLVCVSGHRRLLALEVLDTERVTCALKMFRSDRHRALAGLAENINREDLHFLDKADGYGLLAKQGMTANEIAALLDSDSRTVGKYIRASAWDGSVKRRIRELGSKATTRFLLNMLAAGERTTEELHAILDRFVAGTTSEASGNKPPKGPELKKKLSEFFTLSNCSNEQRHLVEKALRFLGYLK